MWRPIRRPKGGAIQGRRTSEGWRAPAEQDNGNHETPPPGEPTDNEGKGQNQTSEARPERSRAEARQTKKRGKGEATSRTRVQDQSKVYRTRATAR